jgi:hypothetical protein
MLVKNFGDRLGTIVVEDYSSIEPYLSAIRSAGYFWSDFGRAAQRAPYDREAVIAVLVDWGWSGPPEDAPPWYRNASREK